jgi:hypothetical protein
VATALKVAEITKFGCIAACIGAVFIIEIMEMSCFLVRYGRGHIEKAGF